jgi:trk system potassium uptake protein
MRQYAIIGLGSFGVRMLEKLSEISSELIVIDRDSEIIERFKDYAANAYIVDAIDESALKRVIPEKLDAAVVDVGSNLETAILITNELKKLGVKEIIVKADSDERGEILRLIGATRVVYADREAAARIVPLLVSPSLFSFMPIGSNLVMAEVMIPEKYVGMSLTEANLRQRHDINVIAIRSENGTEYRYFSADYKLSDEDILLVAGKEKDVIGFSGVEAKGERNEIGDIFKGLLKGRSRHKK